MYLTSLDQAAATGMSYLFRSTGSVVGITTTQCVLQNLLKIWLTDRIHGPNAEYVYCLPKSSSLIQFRLLQKSENRQERFTIPILYLLKLEE